MAHQHSARARLLAVEECTEDEAFCVELDVLDSSSASPKDVVLVVDTSGSMGTAANAKAEGVAALFSKLDVVKHALKTVAASLGEEDRIAVVTFDSDVSTVLPLTKTDSAGHAAADEAVANLRAGGTTALWPGLRQGLEVLRCDATRPGATGVVLLLTDGLPTPPAPRGELTELCEYLAEHRSSAAVHAFGVGYSLDSALLESLALAGGGSFNFIPDAGLVGTVVINALANAAAGAHSGARLRLPGVKPEAVRGNLRAEWDAAEGATLVHVGDLRGGETRHVLVRGAAPASAALLLAGAGLVDVVAHSYGAEEDARRVARQAGRCAFVEEVPKAMKRGSLSLDAGRAMLATLIDPLERSGHPVLEDLTGQVAEAFASPEAYQRWGRHFLPSLVGAHRDERCNNFKDPGVQSYGGLDFLAWRDNLDGLFCTLTPPTPSLARERDSAVVATGTPVTFAATWYDRHGGCFAPETLVRLAGGEEVRIDALRKGTVVALPSGGGAAVRCVTRHVRDGGVARLVRLPGGPGITAWHPVRLQPGGDWSFPAWHGEVREEACDAVWNVVLESGSSIFADGLEACSLGHGLTEDVVRHPYFGTDAVVKDLARLPGFDAGLVTVGAAERDAVTGRVCALLPSSEAESLARKATT